MIRTWQITAKQTKPIELPKHSSFDEITRQLPDGFYSTFRTYGHGTRVIGLKAHLQRLYQPVKSADANEGVLRRQLRLLLEDYPNEARVRVVVTRQGRLYVSIEPLKQLPREVYEKGVHVETVEMARRTPRLKSTAFITRSREERQHIAREGLFEALMVKNGKITEGITSNFFYVKDLRPERSAAQSKGKVLSDRRFDFGLDHPSTMLRAHSTSAQRDALCTAQRDILLGVTRRTVIRVARRIGLQVKYQPLRRDQLNDAREAFITSSSRGIVPVVQIDNVTVGEGRVGAITRQLSAAYEAYVLEKAESI